jgi:hypothetical protein
MHAFLVTIMLVASGMPGFHVSVLGPYQNPNSRSSASVATCERMADLRIAPEVSARCVYARSPAQALKITLSKSEVRAVRRSTDCVSLKTNQRPFVVDYHEYYCRTNSKDQSAFAEQPGNLMIYKIFVCVVSAGCQPAQPETFTSAKKCDQTLANSEGQVYPIDREGRYVVTPHVEWFACYGRKVQAWQTAP